MSRRAVAWLTAWVAVLALTVVSSFRVSPTQSAAAAESTLTNPTLLTDVNDAPVVTFGPSASVDGAVFFTKLDSVHHELWRSDGTANGTAALMRFPATCSAWRQHQSSCITDLAARGSQLFFVADDGVHGAELWISDGTPAGTLLIKDITPGGAGSSLSSFALIDGALFFDVRTGPTPGLWTSDGTAAGTKLVKGFATRLQHMTRVGGELFFDTTPDTHSISLWKSDGTTAGTVPVTSWTVPADAHHRSVIGAFTDLSGSLVFIRRDLTYGLTGYDWDEASLWRSDGTAIGTTRLARWTSLMRDPLAPVLLAAVGGTVYLASNGLDLGLWKSDGTQSGTVRVSATPANATALVNSQGALWLAESFQDENNYEHARLWTSDGTELGTTVVSGAVFDALDIIGASGQLYLRVNGNQIWRSDGTNPGTVRLHVPNAADSQSLGVFKPLGKDLLWAAWGTGGTSLWRTDGTAGGTSLITVVDPRSVSSNPREFTAAIGKVFFTSEKLDDYGIPVRTVWSTGGSTGTTSPITTGSYIGDEHLVRAGALVFFTDTGTLWRTDGTRAGTHELKSYSIYVGATLAAVGNSLFFDAENEYSDRELWKSDGTTAGTVRVKDIRAGLGGSYPRQLTAVGSRLYFTADDGVHGRELWASNGTAAGTVLVRDARAGRLSSAPSDVTRVGNRVFFAATDGVRGNELWVSNGTAAGTHLVKDIWSGSFGSWPTGITDVNGVAYFTATDAAHGRELWRSDGTATGTVRVKDIIAGAKTSWPTQLTAVAGRLFFTANDGVHGYELWISNGTTAGTRLVADIRPGAVTSAPTQLTAIGATLVFCANDGVHGYELWTSDGTAAGSRLIADINPHGSSNPSQFVLLNHTLVLAADDGTHGNEPMTFPWSG